MLFPISNSVFAGAENSVTKVNCFLYYNVFIRIFFGFRNIISNDYIVYEASFKTFTKSVL